MSDLQTYLSKVSSGEIQALSKDATPEDVVASAKALGYTFTVEELSSASTGDDLDEAGGGCNFNMGDINV
tara:strand:- start:1080 stop:1289 length:210 start_codon:yes stop_codon:yes gene_type:complete